MLRSCGWLLVSGLLGAASATGAEKVTRPVPLINAGFESAMLHAGWTLHVYGAQPSVTLDTQIRHEGRQSLRVTSPTLSDTAFGQELQLQPGRWYRLRGWIRTEALDPHGSPTAATLQVQQTAGVGVIASGRNHTGTSDWTQETLCFTPPADGLTRIALFFVGYGKGTGTVWFDGLTLEEIEGTVRDWTVTREPLVRGQISPFQYGQFIEYLCGLTLSMHAEKVFDGSFEGVPEYRFEFRRAIDRLEQPWYPDGATHRGDFALDPQEPFNGKVAQRISQRPGDPCTLGVSQSGKSVRRDESVRCALYLRSAGLQSPVRVSLWGESATYATAEFRPTEKWERYEALLRPTATDAHATFTISFRGPGTLWIDQVSLLPTETVGGWRRDVAETLKELRPGIIRFGGSTTEGFDWSATIGNPDKRVPFTTCWGGLEPGNAGLEEFVQLCRWVGAEPLICVRFTGRQPADAAVQVEYFNGPASSPMGKRRAANGHPEPYRVIYWQIGNELGDEDYQKGLAEFCRAMKAVDPSIKLLASYPSPGLLQQAGQYLDYICPHHYGCHNLQAMEADVQRCRQLLAEHAPGRAIRLGITEWNTTAGDRGLGRAMLWTLDNALACSRYHNFMHRHCDLIEIANRSNLVDSFCSGIIQTDNCRLFKTPTYYAQQLYATHAGQIPLKIAIDTDLPGDPALDASATQTADGRTTSLFVVNYTTAAQQRTLDLRSLQPQGDEIEVWTLADTAKAGERDAANSWREPDRIRTEAGRAVLSGGKLSHQFPALSLTVLKLQHAPAAKKQ